MYIPTVLLKTLKNIYKKVPDADLLISDFSSLFESIHKEKDIIELNRPIISTKSEGPSEKQDYKTILDPKIGTSDIFFQTDFDFLQFLVNKIFKKQVIVCNL